MLARTRKKNAGMALCSKWVCRDPTTQHIVASPSSSAIFIKLGNRHSSHITSSMHTILAWLQGADAWRVLTVVKLGKESLKHLSHWLLKRSGRVVRRSTTASAKAKRSTDQPLRLIVNYVNGSPRAELSNSGSTKRT